MTEQTIKQTFREAGMEPCQIDVALSLVFQAKRAGYAEGVSDSSAGFDVTLANIAKRLTNASLDDVKKLRYDLLHKDFP